MLHAVEPAPTVYEYWGHWVQSARAVAPGVARNVPAGHSLQAPPPMYWPAGHWATQVEPEPSAYRPAEHVWQVLS